MCYIETAKKESLRLFFCFDFKKYLFDALLFPVLVRALFDLWAQGDEGDQVRDGQQAEGDVLLHRDDHAAGRPTEHRTPAEGARSSLREADRSDQLDSECDGALGTSGFHCHPDRRYPG